VLLDRLVLGKEGRVTAYKVVQTPLIVAEDLAAKWLKGSNIVPPAPDDLEVDVPLRAVLGRIYQWREKPMAQCNCCGRDKPDVRIRVGLRGQDPSGSSTAKPFHGPLCNDCLERADRVGSPEQRWLFHQTLQRTPIPAGPPRIFGREPVIPEHERWGKARAQRLRGYSEK
jgi:hypothetical protein